MPRKAIPVGKKLQDAVLGDYAGFVEPALAELEKGQAAGKIWSKDPGLWRLEPEHQKIIRESLGWLTVIPVMRERSSEIVGFADEVRRGGFADVLLLGMGGSSLFPEVLSLTFGSAPGFPRLRVLDSTDPAALQATEKALDLTRTLIVVASKSGTTPEILALSQYFAAKEHGKSRKPSGDQWVAITDPGTPLEALARARSFRRIFFNPTDIGGRYSALSYFGLLPAALIGVDPLQLLERADRMARLCHPNVQPKRNPGLWLGAVLGGMAREGIDKITFLSSKEISAFGSWVEQLLAESTGKDGKGIVPVDGETPGMPSRYGKDRLFVYLKLEGARDDALEGRIRSLERAGFPVVTLYLQDLYDLGGESFRWEFATAAAGALIGVNPFDQPNVQESKDNTKRLLEEYKISRALPEGEPIASYGDIHLYGDDAARSAVQGARALSAALSGHFSRARAGDYVALTAYLERSEETEKLLGVMRHSVRDRFKVATTLGYGPRFLHSTGQLHKGGGDRGVFLQITADDPQDIEIPGEPYSFGVMKRAQALGDLRALQRLGRRALRVHLAGNMKGGLKRLQDAFTRISNERRPETSSRD